MMPVTGSHQSVGICGSNKFELVEMGIPDGVAREQPNQALERASKPAAQLIVGHPIGLGRQVSLS